MEKEAGSSEEAPARGDEAGGEVVLERGPGVHVVAHAQPARAGRLLASTIGADLADSPAAVELAVRARLTLVPGVTAPGGAIDLRDSPDVIDVRDPAVARAGGDPRSGPLPREVARLGHSTVPTPTQTLAVAHVSRLRQLAAALERAERVHTRTEHGATARMHDSEPSGPVVDSDTLRAPGTHRLRARPTAPTRTFSEDPRSQVVAEPGVELQQVAQVRGATAPSSPRHPRSSAPIAGGVVLLGVALAGAILLTSVPPVLAIAPILLGLFVAGLVRRTTPPTTGSAGTDRPVDPAAHAPMLGVSIDAPTAREARLRPAVAEEPQGDVTSEVTRQLALRLDEAQQERTALVGTPADVGPVTPVARSANASGDAARAAAGESAAVRAAASTRDRAREAWRAAWADLGVRSPPDATIGPALDTHLVRLQRRIEDGVVVLGGSQSAADDTSLRERLNELLATRPLEVVVEHEPGPVSAAAAPLVLVEPFVGLDDAARAALQRELEALADRHEVIVIVHDGPRRTPSEA